MYLIIGLGNPGKEYEKTRHNIGFYYLDKFAEENNFSITKQKFNSLYGETFINNEKHIFVKPQTYMNLSGEAVKKFVDFYNIPSKKILIIHDDLDLQIGTLRLKTNSSSGGHNGLKNIELHLNTREFVKLKVGISKNDDFEVKDYVLGNFSKKEQEILN